MINSFLFISISLSNLYREFKVTTTSIQFPYTVNDQLHWSVLCLDLESIVLTYMTNQHYHMIKSIQLCGNMMVKNCFSSQYMYEPGSVNHMIKHTGLKCAGLRSLPRELSYPINKGESWHEKYDFIQIPHPSSSSTKYDHGRMSDVRLQTPCESSRQDDNETNTFDEHTSRSLTDTSHMYTQPSISSSNHQVHSPICVYVINDEPNIE
jgi:hypothetical protein